MTFNNLGKESESLVASYLQQNGFIVLELNYKKFFGEIDIIAQNDNLIIFVEVKARKTPKTSMFEIVTRAKQQKIIMVAQEYIAKKNLEHVIYRFDVALVKYQKNNEKKITYIPNAFCQKEE